MLNYNKLKEEIVDAVIHVKINKYELDIEFTKQPTIYHRYANIQSDLEEEKSNLRAELDDEIRKEYLKSNKKPPSEAYVKSVIENNKQYIKLLWYLGRIDSILKSLEQKKRCLEKLADLARDGYYAEPKQPAGYEEDEIE